MVCMIIVVSKNKGLERDGILRVETLREATLIVGRIDCLVYHKSNETPEDKVTYLTEMKDKTSKIIYICNEKDTDIVVKMFITGVNGKYFDDEFFIEDSGELVNLVNSLDEVTEVAELGGVSVLSDFLNRYLKNGSSNFSSNYLMVVKEAVQNLMMEYNQKNFELLQMSENATELFANTAEVLSAMKKEHGEMQKTMKKLESDLKKNVSLRSEIQPVGNTRPSLLFFPQISYMKEKKIIRIKEIGNFKYLISFALGLRLYLENIRNLRPKLIVVDSVGEMLEERYSEFSWVNQYRVRDRKYFYNSVVFTNCPNKDVLFTLLDDTDYDTFIVIDRTKNSKSHILNSKGSLFYAVGSESSIEKFKLPVKSCISNMKLFKGCLFEVGFDSDYPEGKSMRERFYLTKYNKSYSMLI